ncbi:hypothetical protein FB561_0114 [Kribbella amoyensis]|uniref:DUF3800 domain-containing protein n=1 Tax=Kribbella amoyensis TaxID=996641 RepID=A0A561BJL6_9ACTN|nr:NAD-dependent protein deacetylase of SIR2 family [Kribbella amoyensis]TWD79064.1 hypothetical protein FB561_0114 [Kribbella amoyensis]
MEIACDESGYEGEKLVGGVTRLFAHASVRLSEDDAAACIAELRRLIRSPATEYKANVVMRSKNRQAMLWLLGPDGPLTGRSELHLIDKTRFLIDTVADVVFPEVDKAVVDARFVDNPALLEAANDVLRSRADGDVETVFLDALGDRELADVGRERVKEFRARQPELLPVLDPLWPAILHAAEYWGAVAGVDVEIVHDRQTALSDERIVELQRLANARKAGARKAGGGSAGDGSAGGGLAGVTLQGAFDVLRIQMADFLAGIATRITSQRLQGNDDPEVVELLRPYVSSPTGLALLA